MYCETSVCRCRYLVILLIFLTGNSGLFDPLTAQNSPIAVGKAGFAATIEDAIDLADPGDTIRIRAGIYPVESITIDKAVTLEGTEGVVIDLENDGFGLIIRGHAITLKNFEIRNSGAGFMDDYAAVLIEDSDGIVIENLTLSNNFFGIYVAKSRNVIINNNTILSNSQRQTTSGNGIHIWYSKEIDVSNNRIEGHRDGIYMEFVENSRIAGNHVKGNIRYGLHFMYSNNCSYIDNLFQNNVSGVAVMYSKQVVMHQNRFVRNWGGNRYGLLLKEITDSEITSNHFSENTVGIYSEASNRITLQGNEFIENGTALRIMANGVDNRIVSNNFINNTFEVTTNSRQNPNYFEGNFWSRYDGYDLDRDGVGDIPYRPVRFFSILTEKQPAALVLMNSIMVHLLDTAERILPVLTPDSLIDNYPQMTRIQ